MLISTSAPEKLCYETVTNTPDLPPSQCQTPVVRLHHDSD